MPVRLTYNNLKLLVSTLTKLAHQVTLHNVCICIVCSEKVKYCVFFSGWFRAILPKSALRVEEEAWNAYPYTKTIFRCPFIEKFSITIETVYHQDSGTQENVFNLSQAELRNRVVGKSSLYHQNQQVKYYI